MGIYSQYLDQPALDLIAERKKQLAQISKLRNRDVLVYASDSSKARQGAPVAIDNSDLLPITDQISNLSGTAIDVLLETGGGSGETAEDIVRLLYDKYESVAFIIPGMAKSAGTIMVMAGDEILMEPASSLGPIDAQIQWEGKVFSAEAFLKGLESIKAEATATNSLNRAYIPILQRISPGEIQHAENALEFAKVLVTDWLKTHKFKNWISHRTNNPGTPVTPEQKAARAKEVADSLCDHSKWLTHGRSIKIPDLQSLGLEIMDYSKCGELADAIRRYQVLLQMTFDTTGIYKTTELFPNERNTAAGCVFNGTPEDTSNMLNGNSQSGNYNTPIGTVSEMSSDIVNFAAFIRMGAAPTPAAPTQSTLNGASLFGSVGCALCHSPSLTSAASPYTGMGGVTYAPYSDFALHHMGSGLADGITQGAAGSDQFRTAPLWGLGQRLFFLHDGRTADLSQAIEDHADSSNCRNHQSCNSEADGVIRNFKGLSASQVQDLLNFLRSL